MYVFVNPHGLANIFQLRKQYQKSVQDRNDLGLQLIERNEEVSVFYEKVNTQEGVIKQATLQLELREEELRMLNLEVRVAACPLHSDFVWSSASGMPDTITLVTAVVGTVVVHMLPIILMLLLIDRQTPMLLIQLVLLGMSILILFFSLAKQCLQRFNGRSDIFSDIIISDNDN